MTCAVTAGYGFLFFGSPRLLATRDPGPSAPTITLYLTSPWLVFATPPSMPLNRQFLSRTAPSSTASFARYWSKRSLSVVYPSCSSSVTLPLGSTSLMPWVSRQRRFWGMSKRSSSSL